MLRDSDFFRSLLDSLDEGVYFVDRERCITYWNRGAERISGYTATDVVGTHCFDALLDHVNAAGTRLCHVGCPLAATMHDGCRRDADVWLHHKEGHRVPVRVHATPIRDPGGTIIGAIEVFRDTTAQMAALQRFQDLEKVAYVDALTELPNRTLADLTLRARLDELTRHGWPFGLAFVDVDRFKHINDSHGHDAGDTVLRAVAGTLRAAARSLDLVARWGGDEFVAVLAHADADRLAVIAERLRALVASSPVAAGGARIAVTVSVGAASARPDDTPESLLARADALMYEAKLAGRNRVTTG
jgi:diguanylate cyclase (GGDEF)-like protein/PAS domain S-box-containing protein